MPGIRYQENGVGDQTTSMEEGAARVDVIRIVFVQIVYDAHRHPRYVRRYMRLAFEA